MPLAQTPSDPPMTDALKTYLATRRTIPAAKLDEPGPDAATLEAMLTIAARVPDHGKLAPWRFILVEGAARAELGARLAAIHRSRHADANEDELRRERARFLPAPLTVVVVSRAATHPKIPEWEQVLSAGAVAMNLVHAAHAHGFAAQWLTGWHAYDREALAAIGVGAEEKVAGFIHIGTPTEPPSERVRPELADLVTRWSAG